MPLISVIIACLNDLANLPRAVDSVQGQDFTDWELVIMDGASGDGTQDYLRTLTDSRIVWRSEKDRGLTQAWNKAVSLARGEWLIFLGADDFVWDDKVFGKAAAQLRASNVALAYGEVHIVAQHDDTIVRRMVLDKRAFLADLNGSNDMQAYRTKDFSMPAGHSKPAYSTHPSA